jgi:virginiamycin A acetyltransferase
MQGQSPDDPRSMKGFPQVGFLKPLVKSLNIVVGDYSYYDDPEGPEQFEAKCVLYHSPSPNQFEAVHGPATAA